MAIISPFQLRTLVESLFEVVPSRSTRDEIVIVCQQPGCSDKSGNRSVNLKSGKTNCWRCNVGGSFQSWARSLGHDVEVGEAPAPTLGEMDTLVNSLSHLRPPAASGYVPVVSLPRGFRSLVSKRNSAYAELIGEMAERKRLTLEDMIEAGVGYTTEDPKWEPYAIFPVNEWNRPVYYQGRTYVDPKEGSTKKFPSRVECPLGSRYWIYDLDLLRSSPGKIAIIVESILNVISVKKELARRGVTNAIPLAVFKHKISSEQAVKLLAARPSEICLLFDGDAVKSAGKDAGSLFNSCRSSVAEMPNGVDPNDDAVLAVDMFLSRKKYDRFFDLTV